VMPTVDGHMFDGGRFRKLVSALGGSNVRNGPTSCSSGSRCLQQGSVLTFSCARFVHS
jgi:hypothetical protein